MDVMRTAAPMLRCGLSYDGGGRRRQSLRFSTCNIFIQYSEEESRKWIIDINAMINDKVQVETALMKIVVAREGGGT